MPEIQVNSFGLHDSLPLFWFCFPGNAERWMKNRCPSCELPALRRARCQDRAICVPGSEANGLEGAGDTAQPSSRKGVAPRGRCERVVKEIGRWRPGRKISPAESDECRRDKTGREVSYRPVQSLPSSQLILGAPPARSLNSFSRQWSGSLTNRQQVPRMAGRNKFEMCSGGGGESVYSGA